MFQVRPSLPSTPFAAILAIDFETYYDSEYTLKKLATSAYVRDQRFKAYGASVRLITPGAPSETDWVRADELPEFLGSIDWSVTAQLSHHTAFDGLIMSHHYGVIPSYYLDTMSMARGLHDHSIGAGLDEVAVYYGQKGKTRGALESIMGVRDLSLEQEIQLAAYAINDTDEMVSIFEKMIVRYPEDELNLIHALINMFCNPVLEVDQALAREELIQEIIHRETILEQVSELIVEGGYYEMIHEALQDAKPYKTELGKLKGAQRAREKRADIPRLEKVQSILSSNTMFPMLISALGEEVAYKDGKKGPIPAIAKDDLQFRRLLVSDVSHVAEVCEARLNVKSTIGETRAARLIEHSLPRLPIMLNYNKAHTMRMSGGDKLNPQNFPAARKGNPARLRRAIRAPRGHVIGVADSSQIEDRKNCWLAGQGNILELYRNKEDVYCYQAEELYDVPHGTYNKHDNEAERGQGKVARLGLGYGCGHKKYRLINQVGAFGPPQPKFSEAQAMRDVDRYRSSNQHIVQLWNWLGYEVLPMMLRGDELLWTPPFSDKPLLRFHGEGVDMPNGLTLWYPDLDAEVNHYTGRIGDFTYKGGKNGGRKKIYGGLFTENLVQCLARIVVGEQLLQIAEFAHIVMMTHDENIFLLPRKGADEKMQDALDIMSTPPSWAPTLPVAAEGGFAENYSK